MIAGGIQNYTDSPNSVVVGGSVITGHRGTAPSLEHDMFTAALFKWRLCVFIAVL